MLERIELTTFRPVSSTQTTITHATLHLVVVVYHIPLTYISDLCRRGKTKQWANTSCQYTLHPDTY